MMFVLVIGQLKITMLQFKFVEVQLKTRRFLAFVFLRWIEVINEKAEISTVFINLIVYKSIVQV